MLLLVALLVGLNEYQGRKRTRESHEGLKRSAEKWERNRG
jgi:hypothetical protein